MNEEEFAVVLGIGHEVTGTEFKGPGPASDRQLFAQVTKAVLGMANKQDGGRVIIGVADDGGNLNPVGLAKTDLDTWKYDDVAAKLAEYADPSVSFDLRQERHLVGGKDFVILYVAEFDVMPILCKRPYSNDKAKKEKGKVILRQGACYVRSRRKPETTEVSTQEDMRDLLELAAEKWLVKLLEQTRRAGGLIVPFQAERIVPSSQEPYDKQLGGL